MSRYFIDTEFIDDGKTIDLISIGIVCEDGRELYLQSVEFDASKASGWVREHVLSHLNVCSKTSKWAKDVSLYSWKRCDKDDCVWRRREEIKQEVLAFMDGEKYGKPELWGYYSAYDHVAFAQLFGTMMDLPNGYPMLTYDLRQWLDMNGMGDIHQPDSSVHNALEDARWIASTYKEGTQRRTAEVSV